MADLSEIDRPGADEVGRALHLRSPGTPWQGR
jgi:hypothetical protein